MCLGCRYNSTRTFRNRFPACRSDARRPPRFWKRNRSTARRFPLLFVAISRFVRSSCLCESKCLNRSGLVIESIVSTRCSYATFASSIGKRTFSTGACVRGRRSRHTRSVEKPSSTASVFLPSTTPAAATYLCRHSYRAPKSTASHPAYTHIQRATLIIIYRIITRPHAETFVRHRHRHLFVVAAFDRRTRPANPGRRSITERRLIHVGLNGNAGFRFLEHYTHNDVRPWRLGKIGKHISTKTERYSFASDAFTTSSEVRACACVGPRRCRRAALGSRTAHAKEGSMGAMDPLGFQKQFEMCLRFTIKA